MTAGLLEEAEGLEVRAAGERVAYYCELISSMTNPAGACGTGTSALPTCRNVELKRRATASDQAAI